MKVTVRFFASLKEAVGQADTALTDESLDTVRDAWSRATENKPLPDNLLCAVNHQHVNLDHVLKDGDEVAFFPPVTGG